MATNGMTIDGLNTVTSITAQDKVPVWDNEATGEPTRKITGQNLANSVKSLANLPNTTEMNTAIAQSTAPTDVSLTILSGNTMTYTCKRVSNVIYLAIDVTERSGSVTFTIPSGALPGYQLYVPMIDPNGVTNGYLYLRPNGNCTASIVGRATVAYIPQA